MLNPLVRSSNFHAQCILFFKKCWLLLSLSELYFRFYCPFIVFLVVGVSWWFGATEAGKHDYETPENLYSIRSTFWGRQRVLFCGNDPSICLDREKNPWGGSTCCFQKLCKDTLNDMNNCGGCGKSCSYGLVCCDGKCVDTLNDPQHCGGCFQECSGQQSCAYAMCDYGG